MKKKNMISNFENIQEIKYAMVESFSIIDDEDLIRDLVKKYTDVKEKDIEKMTETILYLIENNDSFVREIENDIIKLVYEVLEQITDDVVGYHRLLNILESYNIIDSKIEYHHELEKNLSTEDGKMYSYLVIPITSNWQKHLFIEFDVLVRSVCTIKTEIKITNIYID